MSEVKRYHVTEAGLVEGEALGRISVVLGADFDRVTAERDALQTLLTAADERADLLEGLLRLAIGAIGENQWTLLTKDIDATLSLDAERTNSSGKAHCPHDGICHTREETCAEAQARIASLTAPAGADQ
ncbi:hypothetical protein HX794_07870 [Pseudomonas costantinii]|uniref:hypothetical protein n=1 Tax=Pseudomonas costantinii TaxID=168469 RepID=UPI0015A250D4|nr:hypothetical protein [Pseudomonas costantinii]NVZ19553.1 hypothetical protein [Pseudomonas costantinii]